VFRTAWARTCSIAVLAAALVLMSAGVALAVPSDPTLSLVDLQARIDAAYAAKTPLMGYMKTVDLGSTIETIPVQIVNLSAPATDTVDNLIIFEAQGAQIDKFGGIVAGMSGSPIYLNDSGVDKVIGAVSYGDTFTKGGSGLATPIEEMLQMLPVATTNAPQVDDLSKPVLMNGRVIDRIIVPTNPAAYKSQSQAGSAFIAKPLTSMYIGGLNPRSPLYAVLKRSMVAHGQAVLPLGATLSAGTSTFSTDLVPGAAVGALLSRGDLWLGGIGTVTYTDANNVLVFGHPLNYDGPTSVYMTNAIVSSVWPSQYEPYKVAYPTAIRGSFTHDGEYGLLGTTDTVPPEVAVTAHATDADNGHTAQSSVSFTSMLFDSGETSYYGSYAASLAGYKLHDQAYFAGSAMTTATVVVSDRTGRYTVTIPDLWDSSNDVAGSAATDVSYAISSIQSLLSMGFSSPHIEAIDLETSMSSAREYARVVGVAPKTSLKVGDNKILVSMLVYGNPDTQTVQATLTIPSGTSLDGMLVAQSPYYQYGMYSGSVTMSSDGTVIYSDSGFSNRPIVARKTLAQTVADLNSSLPNNSLKIDYYAGPSAADMIDSGDAGSAEATTLVPWYTDGEATIQAATITAHTAAVPFGFDALVMGDITGPSGPVTVSVYGTAAGETSESLLATDTAIVDPDTGNLSYEIDVPALYTNTALRVHIDAGSGYSAADASAMQYVRALVSLRSSAKSVKYKKKVTLTASVMPGECTGTVTFQYYDPARRAWRSIGARTLAPGVSSAKASISWAPPKGSRKVRFVYGGCALNAGATSGSLTITAK
jgi:hypothetical protein